MPTNIAANIGAVANESPRTTNPVIVNRQTGGGIGLVDGELIRYD